jgi:hypothetical protein
VVLLASCTGSPGRRPSRPGTSASAVTSAGADASACSYLQSGVSGFAASSDLQNGNRLVFGRVSVHTDYSQAPVPVTDSGPWRYWQKRPILIMAGTGPITVSVPPSWRHRAAITYGTYGIVSSVVLTACRQPSGVWDGYAGGIYLRSAASCVPLVFATGNQSITVRFSIAGRCG